MNEFESIIADASDARYASRGCTVTQVGDALVFAKNGVVWEMIVRVGEGKYVTTWAYDDERVDWRAETFDADDCVEMRGSWALEAMAYDRA